MTPASFAVLMSGIVFAAVTATPTLPLLQVPLPPAAAAQDPFPEATGKDALLKVCGECHAAETVIHSLKTRQEWSDVLDQMALFGAHASDQEYDQILSYLTTHFSPIKVNKATAKELEALLEVPADVAEAIVAYRLEKGEIKTVDELKNVPGLDGARVEALKARIVF